MLYRMNQNLDTLQVIGGLAGGALAAVNPQVFAPLLLVLIVAMVIDWIMGRRSALYRGVYDRARSRAGLHSKAGTLMILLLLRVLEGLLPRIQLPEWTGYGIGASVVVLALVVDELESIEDHIVSLGGQRIPIFGVIFAKLRAVTGASRRVKGGDNPPGAPTRPPDDA